MASEEKIDESKTLLPSKVELKENETSLGTVADVGAVDDRVVRFVCIGDWGEKSQLLLDIASNWKERLGEYDFIVSLGDNCYLCVDESDAEAYDWFWQDLFADTFKDIPCTWYPVLGNHDWEGLVSNQLEYTNKDPKWHLPHIYYTKTFSDNLLEIFFIDTATLCISETYSLTGKVLTNSGVERQYMWLDHKLASSKAHWKVVCGHYPVYCDGENGSTQELQRLERLMHKYKVDAYICGHDHVEQYLFNETTNIHHFVSGTGSSIRNFRKGSLNSYSRWKGLSGGYLKVEVQPNILQIDFTSSKGVIDNTVVVQKVCI